MQHATGGNIVSGARVPYPWSSSRDCVVAATWAAVRPRALDSDGVAVDSSNNRTWLKERIPPPVAVSIAWR